MWMELPFVARGELKSQAVCPPPNVVAENQSNLSPLLEQCPLNCQVIFLAPDSLKNIFL